ncbi:sterol desaturase family protein [Bernardetia sp. OM2101]|uniref:sterol desaturase family protein n=1 Tax=Bernardetia sp. OM2101 TaxID=3344876 RepID=UPI0035D044D6
MIWNYEHIKDSFDKISQSDPVTYFAPFFLLLILLELGIDLAQKKEWYTKKDAFASIAMGIGSIFLSLLAKIFYIGIYMWIYDNFRLFTLPNVWWVWILLVFADDFSFYWHHRLSHQVRILWAAHSNHHSAQSYNLAVALRQSWTEMFYKYIFWLWMPLLGFHPIMMFVMMSISLIYQFFLHTEAVGRLGFLEYFMNTPSHHRVHHATNVKYLDKNHAGIFIIWDRLFGTFIKEDQEKPIYGLVQNLETYNPIRIASYEYEKIWEDIRKPISWKHRINYLIQPPGWSHDGSRKTTKDLVNEMKKNTVTD